MHIHLVPHVGSTKFNMHLKRCINAHIDWAVGLIEEGDLFWIAAIQQKYTVGKILRKLVFSCEWYKYSFPSSLGVYKVKAKQDHLYDSQAILKS